MDFKAYREELAQYVMDCKETNYHPTYVAYLRLFEKSHPYYYVLHRICFPFMFAFKITKRQIWRFIR